MSVSRADVVQNALNQFANPEYIEIGVFEGRTFHALEAGRKVSVDPSFQFELADRIITQPGNEYNEVASDDFSAACPVDRKFHVIFLDGRHTFEQTLRDLMNTASRGWPVRNNRSFRRATWQASDPRGAPDRTRIRPATIVGAYVSAFHGDGDILRGQLSVRKLLRSA